MSGVVKINRGALERMKASVLPRDQRTVSAEQEAAARRQKISAERQARWPNTLDALRHQKEMAAQLREEKFEAARQVSDKKEADFQKASRTAAIERANRILTNRPTK